MIGIDIIVKKDNFYIFEREYLFNSPSAVAQFFIVNNQNGWYVWKEEISNKPHFDLNLHKNLIDQTSFVKIEKLLLVPKQLVNQKVYHSHEKSLVSFLAEKIDEKITSWRFNREKLKA